MTNDINSAAVELFQQEGPGFTLDQLQQNTGLSRATLYRRIGNKEALLKQLSSDGLIDLADHVDIDSKIFAAARRVIADHGFVASTMEQIATQAGLGVATLYRHFGDKENLFRCFIEHMRPALVFKNFIHNEQGDLQQELEQVINTALRFLSENQDLVKILYSWQRAERAYVAQLREGSTTNFSELCRYFARQQSLGNLRQDVPAEDMAVSLSGLLMQYAIYAPVHQNRALDISRDGETILKLFLQGAKAPA